MKHDFELIPGEPKQPAEFDIYVIQVIARCRKCGRSWRFSVDIPNAVFRFCALNHSGTRRVLNMFTEYYMAKARRFKEYHESEYDGESFPTPDECTGERKYPPVAQ